MLLKLPISHQTRENSPVTVLKLTKTLLQTENEGRLGFELWSCFADFIQFFCAFEALLWPKLFICMLVMFLKCVYQQKKIRFLNVKKIKHCIYGIREQVFHLLIIYSSKS